MLKAGLPSFKGAIGCSYASFSLATSEVDIPKVVGRFCGEDPDFVMLTLLWGRVSPRSCV